MKMLTVDSHERMARDQALEAALCQRTWKVDEPARMLDSERERDSYRQHRCGESTDHAARGCVCRYCGEPR